MSAGSLARFIALLPEATLVLDLDGRIEAGNEAASSLFGESGASHLQELAVERTKAEGLLESWARSGNPLPGSLQLRTARGEASYRVDGARFRESGGGGGGDRLFVRIRERRQATETFRALNEKIAELGREVARRSSAESRLAGQMRLLELIARGEPLESCLEAITRYIEDASDNDVIASVLLVEGRHLRHGAAPGLSAGYIAAIDGLEIGPSAGSCGTAAYTGERVIASDLDSDERWRDFKEAALADGLRSCWSVPVLDREGAVLATVAHYGRKPYHPDASDLALAEVAQHFVGIAIERHRAVQALRDRANELAAINERTNEFLAMLGHELRNPLSPIATTIELLREEESQPGERERWLDILDRQVSLMRRLVDDLVDIARVTRGKIALRTEQVDLCEVLEGVCANEAQGSRVGMTRPPEPIWVEADPQRLQQVIGNLLDNARKFTPADGKIEVSCGLSGDWASVVVRDSGEGIETEQLEEVFELFSQGAQPLNRPRGGLGIGLALVRSIVAMHGGRVEARSAGRGCGSEFEIHLPRAGAPRDERALAAAGGPQRGATLDVLVVDDEHDGATLLAMLLERWGHRTRVAHDGRAAVAAAVEDPPDLLLLDIGLPGIDGFEVARRLRAEPAIQRKGCRIIALTGYGQEDDRERALRAGFDAFLVKPVDPGVLQSLLAGRP